MHKLLVLFTIIILAVLFGLWWQSPDSQNVLPSQDNFLSEPTSANGEPEAGGFTASFEIYTNGTKRIFSDAKYHNQSADVYITSLEPGIIYVQKPGTTWQDFFDTLPFELGGECLITGTQQTFCTNETHKLSFFINELEVAGALDMQIKPSDHMRVVYERR